MKFKRIFFTALLLCTAVLTACSGRHSGTELNDGVIVSGEARVTDDCKVMLHFSTFQRTDSQLRLIRIARAESQFICCDDAGEILNSFSVNREIICSPITNLNTSVALGFLDFNLICSNDGVSFLDDSTSLDKPGMTGGGARVTGYIEEIDTAYYLYNLGSGAIEGQYSTILRFVNSQTSYDVIMPYPILYAAYDRVRNQFIYRVSNHSDDFLYGIIDYDTETQRYRYNEPVNSISITEISDKFGDDADSGYQILFEDNVIYEMLPIPVNENVLEDLNLSYDYLDNPEQQRWGVLLLRSIDLNNGTSELRYLTEVPFEGDTYYGFVMSGTQQMPAAAVNGNLYLFTIDEKLNVYNPQTGFAQYDVKFEDTETLSPYDLFGKDSQGGPTLGDCSPVRIFNDGSLYTAHAYTDGTFKIHKYDFSEQCFELYWTSEAGILDTLDKQSLIFSSFEFVN